MTSLCFDRLCFAVCCYGLIVRFIHFRFAAVTDRNLHIWNLPVPIFRSFSNEIALNCWCKLLISMPPPPALKVQMKHLDSPLKVQVTVTVQVGVQVSKLWTDAAALARTEVCTLKIQPVHQALQLVYTLSLLGLTRFIQRFESSRIPFDALCEMFLSLHFVEKCDFTFCTTSVLHCRQDQCYIVPPSAVPSATLLFPLLQLTTTRLELLKNGALGIFDGKRFQSERGDRNSKAFWCKQSWTFSSKRRFANRRCSTFLRK